MFKKKIPTFQRLCSYLEYALPFLFITMHKNAKHIVKSLMVTFWFFCYKKRFLVKTTPSVIDATYAFLGKFEAGMGQN